MQKVLQQLQTRRLAFFGMKLYGKKIPLRQGDHILREDVTGKRPYEQLNPWMDIDLYVYQEKKGERLDGYFMLVITAKENNILKVIPKGKVARGQHIHRFRDLLAGAPAPVPPTGIDPWRDLAHIMYTGGTTGFPKGVPSNHATEVAFPGATRVPLDEPRDHALGGLRAPGGADAAPCGARVARRPR